MYKVHTYLYMVNRLTPSSTARSPALPLRTQSPVILACKPVMQRLDPLSLLPLTQPTLFTSNLEESRSSLNQPLGLDSRNVMHILTRRLDQTVVNNVLSSFAKEGRRRVQVHRSAFDQRFVALGRILARGVAEEA